MNLATMGIFNKLGGSHFVAQTGVHIKRSTVSTLFLALPRNASGADLMSITINHRNMYDVRFLNFHAKAPLLYKREGVYPDRIKEIFTEYTGLEIK